MNLPKKSIFCAAILVIVSLSSCVSSGPDAFMAKNLTPQEKSRILYEKGLALYRKGLWNDAAPFFRKNIELYKDGPSEVFYNRLVYLSRNPPEGKWDGVFRAKEK